MPGSFLDSNVLIYAVSADAAKADRAERLLIEGGTVSVQVLNEVANVLRHKVRADWARTRTALVRFRAVLEVVPATIKTHEVGLSLAERYGLSVWDAMLAAAALEADCGTLWSEDMQDGLLIAGRLRVRNPFRADA